ncbi:hypothetical protein D9M69_549410 [compost metagenome]
MNQLQVVPEQFSVTQAAGGRGQGVEQQADDLAADQGGLFHGLGDAVRDDVLADLLRHRRHRLQVGHHQVLAAAQVVQGLAAFQIIAQPSGRHHPDSLAETGLQAVA